MVARLVRDQEVACSNHVSSTNRADCLLTVRPVVLTHCFHATSWQRAPKKDCVARFFGKRSGNGAHLPFPPAGRARSEVCRDAVACSNHVSSTNKAAWTFVRAALLLTRFSRDLLAEGSQKRLRSKIFWEKERQRSAFALSSRGKSTKRSLPRRRRVFKSRLLDQQSRMDFCPCGFVADKVFTRPLGRGLPKKIA